MNSVTHHKSNNFKKKHTLKRRKKLLTIRILLISSIFIIFSFYSLQKAYISNRCKNLTYAIDYYFTNWDDKNLRLRGVDSIIFLEQNKDTAKVEVSGLSYIPPRYKQRLIGEFKKTEDGSWKIIELSNSN